MASRLAEAHIEGQRRLRVAVATAVGAAWEQLPLYDEDNVPQFLETALPIVAAGQQRAALLTNAYLARAVERAPVALDITLVTGAAVRAGTAPQTVYRRPFIKVWSELQAGTPWVEAVAQGFVRATESAETDVQLASRATLREVGNADDLIVGYQRVPDGDACEFCLAIAGQRYHTEDLQPAHPRCGCSVDVITGTQRPDFSGKLENDQVRVYDHGELGPTLADPAHDVTTPGDLNL